MVKFCVKTLALQLQLRRVYVNLEGDCILSYGRNPQETANRYSVKKISESEFELYPNSEGSSKISLEFVSAYLHFKATPLYVRRYISANRQSYYVIECLVSDLHIGFGGPEGGDSHLVNDCIFAIDNEKLKYATLRQISILSEERYNIAEIEHLLEMGKLPQENKQDLQSPAKLKISYYEDGFTSEISSELGGVMGVSKDYFNELLLGCLNEKVSEINFNCSCNSLSASFKYRSIRDLVIFNNQELNIVIDSFNYDHSCSERDKENT